jgi:hypothetical protein
MKNSFIIAIRDCAVVQTFGQVTAGYRIHTSPAVIPGTNYTMPEDNDPFREDPLDIEQVQFCERPFLGMVPPPADLHCASP